MLRSLYHKTSPSELFILTQVEKLRQEHTEEDDDHIILGTCRFSREGNTRSPATQVKQKPAIR